MLSCSASARAGRHRGRRRQGDRARARHRPRLARRRHRHRQHLRLDDPVGRPAARAPRRAHGHPVARLRAHRGRRLLRPDRRPARLRPGLIDAARRITPDRGRPGSDDLDDRLLRDHVLRPEEVRVRPDPEDDRRAARAHPPVDRGGRERARRGARLLEEHRAADRPGARARPRRSSPRRARSPTRSASVRRRSSRPTGSAGSRRRASRSRPRRSARSSRSAPRSPT